MKRFGWLLVPWLLFGIIVLGWVVYWNIVASAAESRLAAWTAQENAGGAHVSYQHISRHGFPVLMRLEIEGLSYAPARGGWRADTSRADLNIEMLNTEHVILQAKAPIAVTHGDGAVTNVTAISMVASLRTAQGKLAVAGIEADNLTLDDPAQPGVTTIRKVVANVRPDPRATGDYQLAFNADDLTLPRPVRSFETFGLSVPVLHADIVIVHGAALLQSAPNDPLAPWRDAGGQLRFEGLQLHWGPLDTTGTGEGGIDAERRLTGRLVLPIHQPAPVLIAIANGPNVDASAHRALNMLAAGYVVSGHEITLDVDAANGVMRVEGLPVRTLPPVY